MNGFSIADGLAGEAMPQQASRPVLLAVTGLHVHYGRSHVLHGVSFNIGRGEIVTLLGRNGAGRSTTLKAIMGLVPPSAGSVCWDAGAESGQGEELTALRPFEIARRGLAYVPEERLVFAELTVEENLSLGVRNVGRWQQHARDGLLARADARAVWEIGQLYDWFPALASRRGSTV